MNAFNVLLVGIGGFFGAIARYSTSQFINKRSTFSIPIATLFINLLGSLLLGIMVGIGMNKSVFLLTGTGFMGAFTTFSTFKLEGVQLIINKKTNNFILYNLFSYLGGILLAFLGFNLGSYY